MARPSKLAKELGLTAQQESEIREAFSLFAEPYPGEKEGVITIPDVRRALMYDPSLFNHPPFPDRFMLTELLPQRSRHPSFFSSPMG